MQKLIKIFLILLLLINIFYVFSGVVNFQIQSIDTLGIWLLKARAFRLEQGIPVNLLTGPQYLYTHPQYPILFPYILSAFLPLGEKAPLIVGPALYILVLIACYQTLKLYIPPLFSLLFTYIYSMFSPLLGQAGRVHAGNADIVICLLSWLIVYFSSQKKFLSSVLITALASQIKIEGIFFISYLFFFPVSKFKIIAGISLCLIPFIVWQFLIYRFHIPADLYLIWPGWISLQTRFMEILAYTPRELLNYKNWYLFWPLFFLSLFSPSSKKWLLPVGIIYLFLNINFLFNTLNAYSYISSSLDRLLLQLSPFIFTYFAVHTEPILPSSIREYLSGPRTMPTRILRPD